MAGRLQFRLSTLLATVTIVACLLGVWARREAIARDQSRRVEEFNALMEAQRYNEAKALAGESLERYPDVGLFRYMQAKIDFLNGRINGEDWPPGTFTCYYSIGAGLTRINWNLTMYWSLTRPWTRRQLLQQAGGGAGLLALASLLSEQGFAAEPAVNPLAPKEPHFPAKAKSVIWLFMNGGPSQVDTWDHKPELEKRDGKELEGFDKNTGFFTEQVGPVMKSPYKFAQHGQCGKWVSEIFPNMAKHVDDMAFIHSCHTESNNHSPALFMINTGMTRMGFPCVGSWVTYGLGTQSQDLPAFCVMSDPLGRGLPKGYSQNWGAGFVPSIYQGTWLKPQGDAIDNLKPPAEMTSEQQRAQLDLLAELNKHRQALTHPDELELSARIESFELAYRMQIAAPEAIDITKETEATQKAYGIDNQKCAHFAKQCLMARRLVERGVRFVQIYSGGMENERSWDGHQNIVANHSGFAGETDQPIGALLADLKQRGLLESTLVIWGGEFGRLPIVQKGGTGRDHNPHAFTYWLAGGGAKGGVSYGATDELGHKAVVDKVSVNDLHATILHLLGLDHKRLTFRLNGRDFRLTDVAGRVVKEVVG